MAPLNLTFGVEIELVACWPEDPNLPWSRDALAARLRQAGVPAYSQGEDEEDVNPTAYQSWSITADHVELSDAEMKIYPNDYECKSVELSSRKFDFMRDDWRGEIKKVLDVLASIENDGARFFTNASTGLHVHVGNGAEVIPLPTAKNVMQLALAFERCFDQLHAANRIAYPEHLETGVWHLPLTWFSQINGTCPPGASLFEWLAKIEEAQTHRELGALFTMPETVANRTGAGRKPTYGHNSSYNFDNLYTLGPVYPPAPLKGTIEFRQHAGTMDFIHILNWVLLTTSLVRYCSEALPADFIALCAHGVDLDFGLRDLLSAIGCPAETVSFYAKDGEEATDAPIGFLGPRNAPASRLWDQDLDELIAQNEVEQSNRLDAQTTAGVMKLKNYGFDPKINVVEIPLDTVRRYYFQAWAEGLFADVLEDVLETKSRWMVFHLLAMMYKDADAGVDSITEGLARIRFGSVSDTMPGHVCDEACEHMG